MKVKYNECLLKPVIVATIFIFLEAVLLNHLNKRDIETNSLTLSPLPWLGVLIFREDSEGTESMAGVILISDKLAIANARDMAKLKEYRWESIKRAITIMFLTTANETWHARVVDISLHPEFNNETLTTIALLKLQYHKKFTGNMLIWPTLGTVPYSNGEVFTVGYTDRNLILEQMVYRMDYVHMNDCRHFYYKEGLNSVWMRPKRYHCYRVRYSLNTCVFDPGLALVQYTAGEWTLLGMSTWGPGCSLPARFIDFEYFVPWILTNKPAVRRGLFKEREHSEYADLDTWTLERIDDTKMVLRPLPFVESGPPQELVFGKCNEEDTRNGQLIYRDQMNFTTVQDKYAQAVYALSFYDLKFNKTHYTCIMIHAQCNRKSKSRLWYTKSFEQPQLASLIMTIPYKEDTEPFVYHIQEDWDQYSFDTINTDITNLIFRFEFQTAAYFDVYFYGNLTEDYTTAVPEEDISTSPKTIKRNSIPEGQTSVLFMETIMDPTGYGLQDL